MALTYGFYNSTSKEDRVYDAKQISGSYYGMVHDGVFSDVGDGFICEIVDLTHVKIRSGMIYNHLMFIKNDEDYILTIPDDKYSGTGIASIEIARPPSQTKYPVGNKLQVDGIRVNGVKDGSVIGEAYVVIQKNPDSRSFELTCVNVSEFDTSRHILLAILDRAASNITVKNMIGRQSNYSLINDELGIFDDWDTVFAFGDVSEFTITSAIPQILPEGLDSLFKYYYTSGTISYIKESETAGSQFQMIMNSTPLFSEHIKVDDYISNSKGVIFKVTSYTNSGNSISLTAKRASQYNTNVPNEYLQYVNVFKKFVSGPKIITGIDQSTFIDTVINLFNNNYDEFKTDFNTDKTQYFEDWLDNNEYYMYHQSGSTQYSRFQSEIAEKLNEFTNPYVMALVNSESAEIPVSGLSDNSFISIKTDPYNVYIKDVILESDKIKVYFDPLEHDSRIMALIEEV